MFIVLWLWRSEMGLHWVSQSRYLMSVPSGGPRGHPSLALPASEAACTPQLAAPSSTSEPAMSHLQISLFSPRCSHCHSPFSELQRPASLLEGSLQLHRSHPDIPGWPPCLQPLNLIHPQRPLATQGSLVTGMTRALCL